MMSPVFPIIGPIIIGLKIMWSAIAGELSSLISKNVAKSIWEVIKFIFKLIFVIVISLLESITVDFFNNLVKYWKKDFHKNNVS